jgi:hypothetical protein
MSSFFIVEGNDSFFLLIVFVAIICLQKYVVNDSRINVKSSQKRLAHYFDSPGSFIFIAIRQPKKKLKKIWHSK